MMDDKRYVLHSKNICRVMRPILCLRQWNRRIYGEPSICSSIIGTFMQGNRPIFRFLSARQCWKFCLSVGLEWLGIRRMTTCCWIAAALFFLRRFSCSRRNQGFSYRDWQRSLPCPVLAVFFARRHGSGHLSAASAASG